MRTILTTAIINIDIGEIKARMVGTPPGDASSLCAVGSPLVRRQRRPGAGRETACGTIRVQTVVSVCARVCLCV